MPASARGRTSVRSRSTSSLVALDCGADSGTTVRKAVSPAVLYVTGVAEATPWVSRSVTVQVVEREPVLGAADLRDEGQRPVDAGAEALAERS